ncbi:hypothetical protein ZOSMA_127G00030 [Zostera marina]|uniref:Tyrosine specific protein phosphatases domain-containing protein n=1 Tax=Zostera marina TaxID=29655 RepID=A0A0K9Q204_ZOSMR|nr:hypothetical protein ZOSMA_127G00030 [Zostera marina]
MKMGNNKNVLVHCFEGKSRSTTVVLAYLILQKKFTLSEAWKLLKKVHPRTQPNNDFGRILLELDKKIHGKISMKWMNVDHLCGKNTGKSLFTGETVDDSKRGMKGKRSVV